MRQNELEIDEERYLAPIRKRGRGFYLLVGVLSAIVAWAAATWVYQYILGLGVTGMNKPVFWGDRKSTRLNSSH